VDGFSNASVPETFNITTKGGILRKTFSSFRALEIASTPAETLKFIYGTRLLYV